MERVTDQGRPKDLLTSDSRAKHGVGVQNAIGSVLHDKVGKVLRCNALLDHQALSSKRKICRSGGKASGFHPTRKEGGADNPLRHLFDAKNYDGVVLARLDCRGPES
ncbi:unannotated protein [freshwater metagenome]|uniref:Unannotated protein n=1 Tax=freshwater metagenome TaxID=449393 RepID=A0A6J7UHW9_9ZZZZ